jgi:hypothetical protein
MLESTKTSMATLCISSIGVSVASQCGDVR